MLIILPITLAILSAGERVASPLLLAIYFLLVSLIFGLNNSQRELKTLASGQPVTVKHGPLHHCTATQIFLKPVLILH